MVVTCDIQFENNPEATFYAGQVIAGKVTLTADKVKQVKGKLQNKMTHWKCKYYFSCLNIDNLMMSQHYYYLFI